ncbi:endonuclease/exonuclease/phosphatase family protein [Halomicroarcula sp. GCM10025709]|uniref:endonuclease/exonuclease/phosphatase family protein n=1 Tax=Halomicroarcula sp. GCM10025709 TaxID=3252669 RepID=UPI00361F8409
MNRVRVASFNVRYDAAKDGTDNWAHRRQLVAGTIRYHAPAVVGVQEAMSHQLRELQAMLPAYDWVGDPRDSVAVGGEHTAVGYRTDRFDCTATDTFWLSETPTEPGSVGWDAAYPRVATWARLDDGDPLLVVNTHLDHEGERARRRGIDLVLERLDGIVDGEPVVLQGDFNCVVGEPAYERAAGHPRRRPPAGRHARPGRPPPRTDDDANRLPRPASGNGDRPRVRHRRPERGEPRRLHRPGRRPLSLGPPASGRRHRSLTPRRRDPLPLGRLQRVCFSSAGRPAAPG